MIPEVDSLKLSELKKGQKITIRCKSKTLLVDVDAHVAELRGEVVLLHLIRHDGQVVNFSSPNVQIIAIYEDGKDMPKAWVNCRIQRRMVNGKEYHAIAAPKPSVRVNRRKVPRALLDLPGRLRVSDNPEGHSIIVHDMSVNGIGIQINEKINEQELKHMQIEFIDESIVDEDDEYEDENSGMIKVEAKMIWKRQLPAGGYYYGCRLNQMEENLGSYIADKIRENHRHK